MLLIRNIKKNISRYVIACDYFVILSKKKQGAQDIQKYDLWPILKKAFCFFYG